MRAPGGADFPPRGENQRCRDELQPIVGTSLLYGVRCSDRAQSYAGDLASGAEKILCGGQASVADMASATDGVRDKPYWYACTARLDELTSTDSTLEAFRYYPVGAAARHCPVGQALNWRPSPGVPLVLAGTTVGSYITVG